MEDNELQNTSKLDSCLNDFTCLLQYYFIYHYWNIIIPFITIEISFNLSLFELFNY